MNTFLIIIALVLWVGLKSYKSVRQQMADPENSAEVKEPASASVTFAEEECSAGYYSYETVIKSCRIVAFIIHVIPPFCN